MRFVLTEGNWVPGSGASGSVASASGGFPSWYTPVLTRTVSVVEDYESMSALTALVILYVTLVNDPDILPGVPQVIDMPLSPISEAAVTPHLGQGMWVGPGVRYYAC